MAPSASPTTPLVALTLMTAESRTEKKTPWSKSSST